MFSYSLATTQLIPGRIPAIMYTTIIDDHLTQMPLFGQSVGMTLVIAVCIIVAQPKQVMTHTAMHQQCRHQLIRDSVNY